jgi:hypothetical protein
MNKILATTLLSFGVSAKKDTSPFERLLEDQTGSQTHDSIEYYAHMEFNPNKYASEVAKSVGSYTNEKVDLIGADATILASYEYGSKLLRIFASLDKKFSWAKKNANAYD